MLSRKLQEHHHPKLHPHPGAASGDRPRALHVNAVKTFRNDDDGVCPRGPQDHSLPGSMVHLGDSRDSAHSCTQAQIYYSKAESATGKASWGESGRNQAQASKGPFPGDSQRIHLAPLATSCDDAREMLSSREAHLSLGAQGF